MVRPGTRLWHRHPAVRVQELTFGEKVADWLKHWFLGTWIALGLVTVWIAVWIALQRTSISWDLYPFILLNLCLSCLAAVQGIILQISANRGDKVNVVIALHTEDNTDKLAVIARRNEPGSAGRCRASGNSPIFGLAGDPATQLSRTRGSWRSWSLAPAPGATLPNPAVLDHVDPMATGPHRRR